MRGMGLLLAAGIALAVGCAAEKPPPVVEDDDLTAAHLRNPRPTTTGDCLAGRQGR